MDDVAGLGIHFRADAIAVAARFVTLRLEFEDPPVEAVGIPLPYYYEVRHGECHESIKLHDAALPAGSIGLGSAHR